MPIKWISLNGAVLKNSSTINHSTFVDAAVNDRSVDHTADRASRSWQLATNDMLCLPNRTAMGCVCGLLNRVLTRFASSRIRLMIVSVAGLSDTACLPTLCSLSDWFFCSSCSTHTNRNEPFVFDLRIRNRCWRSRPVWRPTCPCRRFAIADGRRAIGLLSRRIRGDQNRRSNRNNE